MNRRSRPVEVLLVEDDPADARLTLESLSESKVRNNVTVIDNGKEALTYLRDEGQRKGRARPDLVMLDLNLPGMSGTDILQAMREDAELASLPVVILTTSDEEKDIVRSYELRASAYVNKPLGLEEFGEVVRAIEQFWFEVVRYPPSGG